MTCECLSAAPTYPVFRHTLHLPTCPKFTEAERLLSALLESTATAEYLRGAVSALGVFRVLSHEEMAQWCGRVGDSAIYDEPSRVYVCHGCREGR